MAASPLPSSMLLGFTLLLACDQAAGDATTPKTSAAEPAKVEAKTEAKAEAKAGPTELAEALPDAPPAMPEAEGTVVDGLSIVGHTVSSPTRTGEHKEDYWTQYQVWGEITNHSAEVFESVSGTITFHDAAGAMIGIDSIGTASKADVGDRSPGERFYAAVHFVQPGQTVPFHFTRNLDAIKGQVASHQLKPRRGTPASNAPKGVALDVTERFEGEGHQRKRMFAATIRNDGAGACRAPALVVAFLDGAGNVAGVERFDASDDLKKLLAEGESMPVSGGVFVSNENAWRETANVKTFVDCQPIY